MVGRRRNCTSVSSCAPPGRYCAISSTGTGTATPPTWTPGDGDAVGLGVGVGNEFGIGVTHGVGFWARAVEQTIDCPRTAPQIMKSLMGLTGGIWLTSPPLLLMIKLPGFGRKTPR